MYFENFIQSLNLQSRSWPAVLMLIGIQASGKSTLAQELHENLAQNGIQSVIINDDEIFRQIAEGLEFPQYITYREVVRAFNHKDPKPDRMLDQFILNSINSKIKDAVACNQSIIWDMPNTAGPAYQGEKHFDQDRAEHFNRVSLNGGTDYKKIGIFLDMPIELATRRNAARPRPLGDSTLQRYHMQLAANIPDAQECDWELFVCCEPG